MEKYRKDGPNELTEGFKELEVAVLREEPAMFLSLPACLGTEWFLMNILYLGEFRSKSHL